MRVFPILNMINSSNLVLIKAFSSAACYLSSWSKLLRLFVCSFGVLHDSDGNNCSDGVNVMSSGAAGKDTLFWSKCSADQFSAFFQ